MWWKCRAGSINKEKCRGRIETWGKGSDEGEACLDMVEKIRNKRRRDGERVRPTGRWPQTISASRHLKVCVRAA